MFSADQIQAMSVPVGSTIRDAMRAIDRASVGVAFLVRADGRFVGLVTDGDLRRALLKGQGLDALVADVARPSSVTAKITDPPEQIAGLFREEVRFIPLLDDAGKVKDAAAFDQRIALPVASPWIGERELQYVTECVVSGWISSSGPFVCRFEEIFARFCGVKHAIASSNGTTALHLAMLALHIGLGDEVIVPTLTFIATANAVTYTGATPIFVDCDPETWTIDVAAVEAAVTSRTRAIIPVHLYGHPANMEPLLALAKRHKLAVVEDAAEAHGALFKGKPVGSIGDIGIFSFYGNKIATTGEGGMLVTNDDAIADKVRLLRDHGMSPDRRYWHTVLGYNYRLTSLQAALGVAQMERIDDIIKAKLHIADFYRSGLQNVPGITLPGCAPWARNVFWLYSVVIDEKKFGRSRDEVMRLLQEQGIDTRPFFPPLHRQPIYANDQNFPVSERLSDTGLSLPSSAHLNMDHITRVCEAIAKLQRK